MVKKHIQTSTKITKQVNSRMQLNITNGFLFAQSNGFDSLFILCDISIEFNSVD